MNPATKKNAERKANRGESMIIFWRYFGDLLTIF
jgi:hypothetical protein